MFLNDFPTLDTSSLTPIDMGTFNTGFTFNDASGVLQTVKGDTFSLTPGVTYGQPVTPTYSYIDTLPAYSNRPLTPITMSTPSMPTQSATAPAQKTAPAVAAPPANQNVV